MPGIDEKTSLQAIALCRSDQRIFSAVGIHPADSSETSFDPIPRLAFEPGVRAIGETGLDFARDEKAPRGAQEDLFSRHIELARKLSMPLVVHSRGAEKRVLEILPEDPGFPVVLHCYTGGPEAAVAAVARGFYVSFAGALTWRRNTGLRELASILPPSRVLAETDSPFMSPEGCRGRRNEPSGIRAVAETLAGAWGMTLAECASRLYENAMTAFRLGVSTEASLIYIIGKKAYVNLTGRCGNDCAFCIRGKTDGLAGYHLRQHADRPSGRFLEALSVLRPADFEELVFCGFGEPTLRPAELRTIASAARATGWKTRLNTNGQATTFLDREEVTGLIGLFDTVSVSLNAWDADSYAAICRPSATSAWDSLLDFISIVRESSAALRVTAVRHPGADLAAVRRLAENLGAGLVERDHK